MATSSEYWFLLQVHIHLMREFEQLLEHLPCTCCKVHIVCFYEVHCYYDKKRSNLSYWICDTSITQHISCFPNMSYASGRIVNLLEPNISFAFVPYPDHTHHQRPMPTHSMTCAHLCPPMPTHAIQIAPVY